jgi:hypothetical protein
LEEENKDFFKAYKLRLAVKKQVDEFNGLVIGTANVMADRMRNKQT